MLCRHNHRADLEKKTIVFLVRVCCCWGGVEDKKTWRGATTAEVSGSASPISFCSYFFFLLPSTTCMCCVGEGRERGTSSTWRVGSAALVDASSNETTVDPDPPPSATVSCSPSSAPSGCSSRIALTKTHFRFNIKSFHFFFRKYLRHFFLQKSVMDNFECPQ